MKKILFKQTAGAMAFFFMVMFFSPVTALGLDGAALPTGGTITAGSGSISSGGSSMTVTQTTGQLIANWDTFNIGKDASVAFIQPGSTACALNRINDQSASRILGRLTANGRVFLVNPSGIIFGQTAQVDAGGLVASTLNITDSDFLNETYTFSTDGSAGAVTNAGTINAGFAAFLSPVINNSGTVVADGGTAAMAAGDKVNLDLTGDGLITFTIDAGAVDAQASNSGLIRADGGLVYLSAEAADELTSAAVNNTGIIRARTLSGKKGKLLLMADMDTGTVTVDGTLDASAPDSGDGGFIETSAASVQIKKTANVTTAAPAGQTGTWLIDPTDFTIAASGGDMTGDQVEAALASNNLTIQSADGATQGDGNIYVNDPVSWSSNTLTLSAYNDIKINSTLTAAGTGTGLSLIYGTGNSDGTYSINAPVNLESDSLFKTRGPGDADFLNYTIITTMNALQGIDSGDLTGSYVLGCDLTDTTTTGAGFDPIGDGTNPFSGIFDGLGHTITDLYIDRPSSGSVGLFGYSAGSLRNIGLINADITGEFSTGALAGTMYLGSLSNSYATGSVNVGEHNGGGLVGIMAGGSVSNSYATCSVSVGLDNGGGLVGWLLWDGSVSNSYATGSVTVQRYCGGGLVGRIGDGSVSNSAWDSTTTGQNSAISWYGGSSVSATDIAGNRYSLNLYKDTLGWDIDDEGGTGSVWRIYDGYTYPMLRSFLTKVSTLTREYNGLTTITGAVLADGSTMDETLLVDKTSKNNLTQGTINAADTNAGTYGIDLSGYYSTQQGYDIVSSASLVIDPKILTISGTTAADKTYDGTTAAVVSAGTLSGLVGSETLGVTGTGIFDSKDAGARTVTASYTLWDGENGGLAGNYALADTTGINAAITPAPLTITADNISKTYDGTTEAVISAGTLSGLVGDETLGVAATGTFDSKNAGARTVTASYTLSDGENGGLAGNYTLADTIVTGAITPAPLTITADDISKTYDGTAYSGGSVCYSGFVPGEDVSDLSGTLAYSGNSQGAKDTGTYTLTPSGLTSGNYTITFKNGSLTITPAPLTITADDISKTYDGMAYSGGSVSYSGFVPGEDVSDLSGTLAYSGNSQGAKDTGTYTLTPSGLTSGNYTITFKNGSLTITPAALTITADDISKTYDGTAYSGGSVCYSGFVPGEDVSDLSGTLAYSGNSQGAKDTGTYTLTPSGLTSGNYTITFKNGSLTITPAPLTITADDISKTYDGMAYSGGSVSYSGFVPGEDVSDLSGTLAYSGNSQGAKDTGTYTLTPSGLTSGNYTITFKNGSLTITPAALTITADDISKTYDGMAYSGGSVSYSGFVPGEDVSDLSGTLAYSGNSQGAKDTGTYTLTPSGLTSGNYTITFKNGSLTITPAALTITADDISKTYDGMAYSGGSVSYSGFVPGEDESDLSGTLAYSGNSQGAKDTGTYTLTPSGLTSGNYTITFKNGSLTITPAALTITADDISKTYDGMAYSGGSVSYSGFVPGEDESDLSGTLAYSGNSQGARFMGSYTITPEGLSSANYAITFVDGRLVISENKALSKAVRHIEQNLMSGENQGNKPALNNDDPTPEKASDLFAIGKAAR